MLRRVYTALLFCLANASALASDPVQLRHGTVHDALYGLCMHGDTGIAVGGYGTVVETADGGRSWNAVPPFTETALLDVSCGNGPSLIVGQIGSIYRLQDGRYQPVASGTDARLLGVADNAAGLAFAVGGFGSVIRSKDGGVTWEPLAIDWQALIDDYMEPHLYAVDVSAEGVVTIVGEFELVIRSLDGGDTWEMVHKGEASLFGLSLNDNGLGFAVGQDGAVIRTEDGGATWAALETPTEGILLDVWSSPSGEVVVSGIRNLLRSRDAGAHWDTLEGGDLNVGWYQGLTVLTDADAGAEVALLAGHQGNIIRLPLK